LASHLSYDPIVDMDVRVDDVPDAGIVSSVRGSSVGVGKRWKQVTLVFRMTRPRSRSNRGGGRGL
jgi:hypothetical protein